MPEIAVRLTDAELAQLDSLVADGGFRTRAEVVRAGIRLLSDTTRNQQVGRSYAHAYRKASLTSEEAQLLDAAAALAVELPV